MLTKLLALIGLELTPNDHLDKALAGLSAFCAIAAMIWISGRVLGPHAAMPVVTSMGASAVLLFAMPHGQLSQPWPLVAGHLLSATVGVSCAHWIANPILAGSVAVGLAITLMYYGRCIHPPGGATALTAVLGGNTVRGLGYGYVAVPVALNVAIILVAAVGANYAFRWRRYPAALARRPPLLHERIAREDWIFALTHVGSMVDVNAEDLNDLHTLALEHARGRRRAKWARA